MDDLMKHLSTHGVFCWNELMTNDVDKAKEFYADLFGWTYEEMPMDSGFTYTMAKLGDKMVGGLMPLPPGAPEGMPPIWGSYVAVDDVDESSKLVEKLGGTVLLPPQDIPGVGRFSVVQDPQGAWFSLFKSNQGE